MLTRETADVSPLIGIGDWCFIKINFKLEHYRGEYFSRLTQMDTRVRVFVMKTERNGALIYLANCIYCNSAVLRFFLSLFLTFRLSISFLSTHFIASAGKVYRSVKQKLQLFRRRFKCLTYRLVVDEPRQ